jgi:glycosyltransferase involved in cell wall biosynthesis
MPPRILHIDSGHDWRGGQRQVLLLARGLRQRGYEPLVIAARGSPLVQRLRRAGVATSAVAMRGPWDLVAARRIRSLVRTWNAQIVHAHDPRAHALALIALLDRPRIPLVVTRRTAHAPRGIRRRYGARISRFVAPSRAVADSLVAAGVPRDRIALVPPGVPAPAVEAPRDWRAECRWPANVVVGAVVGGGADWRDDLLEGIVRRLRPGARRRGRLLLFGGASTGGCTIAGMEAFRAGIVDEIHPAIAGADLLLHLATADTLGTALIDAMALGVPPIAFAAPGLAELVEDGRSGLLVPQGDRAAFARAVSQLIADDRTRRAFAKRGPARAARFGVDGMTDGVEEVYRSVLASLD